MQSTSFSETDLGTDSAPLRCVARGVSSPVVALNRALAMPMVEVPAVALELVEELEDARLTDYYYVPVTAELLRRLGRTDDALLEAQRAIQLTPHEGNVILDARGRGRPTPDE